MQKRILIFFKVRYFISFIHSPAKWSNKKSPQKRFFFQLVLSRKRSFKEYCLLGCSINHCLGRLILKYLLEAGTGSIRDRILYDFSRKSRREKKETKSWMEVERKTSRRTTYFTFLLNLMSEWPWLLVSNLVL